MIGLGNTALEGPNKHAESLLSGNRSVHSLPEIKGDIQTDVCAQEPLSFDLSLCGHHVQSLPVWEGGETSRGQCARLAVSTMGGEPIP